MLPGMLPRCRAGCRQAEKLVGKLDQLGATLGDLGLSLFKVAKFEVRARHERAVNITVRALRVLVLVLVLQEQGRLQAGGRAARCDACMEQGRQRAGLASAAAGVLDCMPARTCNAAMKKKHIEKAACVLCLLCLQEAEGGPLAAHTGTLRYSSGLIADQKRSAAALVRASKMMAKARGNASWLAVSVCTCAGGRIGAVTAL